MAIIGRLDIQIVELTAASCCGAGVVTEANPDIALALNARTFAQAEQLGLDIMTICGTCQGIMGAANKRLKTEPGLLKRINEVLAQDGVTYGGTIQVKHLLWIVVREVGLTTLQNHVRFPLHDLRIAPFYGCYILRPSWDLGFDDPENPSSLEKVIRTVGGQPVSYVGRTKCCGFPIILEKEAIAVAMAGANMKEAKDNGADCHGDSLSSMPYEFGHLSRAGGTLSQRASQSSHFAPSAIARTGHGNSGQGPGSQQAPRTCRFDRASGVWTRGMREYSKGVS